MPTLKEKLATGVPTIGTWITIPHPAVAEILARAGFDWVAVDMEHGAIGIAEAAELIRTIELAGASPLVRLYDNDAVLIKRVLDAGSHGIIVPMVNNAEDARAAVAAAHYPPRGRRGVGLARAQGYGATFEAYRTWLSNEVVVIAQVEHIDAVRNLDSIFSVDGIDGFILGPYDLSASLGVPGEFAHPDVEDALSEVKSFLGRAKVAGGIHVIEPDAGEVNTRLAEGFRFIAFSVDIRILDGVARGALTEINAFVDTLAQ